jgi:hypothetical protein
MLREKLRYVLTNKKYHPHLKKLGRLLIIVGILWIISFPFMARKVFTSENALNGDYIQSNFEKDS